MSFVTRSIGSILKGVGSVFSPGNASVSAIGAAPAAPGAAPTTPGPTNSPTAQNPAPPPPMQDVSTSALLSNTGDGPPSKLGFAEDKKNTSKVLLGS